MVDARGQIESAMATLRAMLQDERLLEEIEKTAELLTACLKLGRKLLIAGNGGSAADAQHMAAELVGRYLRDRPAIAALALTTDTSVLTAWSNDVGFKTVFSRQIEALGKPGDVLCCITTSGNSSNLVEAAVSARRLGMKTVALLGRDGGELLKRPEIDSAIVVPSHETPRIQECHGLLIHILCGKVECSLYPDA
jgi:D-sedoheptulose 7-phosphate isomerase